MPFMTAKFLGPSFIKDPALMKTAIEEATRAERQEAADYILGIIEDKTPFRTGALKEDATYKLSEGSVLARFYYDTQNQIAEYHRAYSYYQEGPPLGVSTYTNDPRQMLYSTSQDARVVAVLEGMFGKAIQEGADAGIGPEIEL